MIMHYTYAHIRLDTNEVFYIGKGTSNRINRTDFRNKHWHNVVNKAGFKGVVLKEFETANEAFEHEKIMIAYHKSIGCNLVNQSNGGEGNSSVGGFTFKGKKHSQESIEKCRLINLGKPKTLESKLKNAESHKQAIKINNIIYNSWLEASKILGIPMGSINYILKQQKPMRGKYSWVNNCELVI